MFRAAASFALLVTLATPSAAIVATPVPLPSPPGGPRQCIRIVLTNPAAGVEGVTPVRVECTYPGGLRRLRLPGRL